jgi:hypothetical protein
MVPSGEVVGKNPRTGTTEKAAVVGGFSLDTAGADDAFAVHPTNTDTS